MPIPEIVVEGNPTKQFGISPYQGISNFFTGIGNFVGNGLSGNFDPDTKGQQGIQGLLQNLGYQIHLRLIEAWRQKNKGKQIPAEIVEQYRLEAERQALIELDQMPDSTKIEGIPESEVIIEPERPDTSTAPQRDGVIGNLVLPDASGMCPEGMIKTGGGGGGGVSVPEFCIVDPNASGGAPPAGDEQPGDGTPPAGDGTPPAGDGTPPAGDGTPPAGGEGELEEAVELGTGPPEQKKSMLARARAWLATGVPFDWAGLGTLGLTVLVLGKVVGLATAAGGKKPEPGETPPDKDEPPSGEDKPPSEKPPGSGKYPELKTGEEIYNHVVKTGSTEGLTPEQQAKAKAHAEGLQAKGVSIPKAILSLLGLIFGGNMGQGPSRKLTDLDEASKAASLQVFNDKTNFMKFAPSPLQQIDSRYYNSKSFVPEGEERNFNTQYRSVPGQEYANYNVVKDREKPFFAEGGLSSLHPRMNGQIEGPGTEKSDDIPAMLSDGEFVVNAAAVRGIGNLIGKKKPKSKIDQRREGARTMYALQQAGEKAARMS